jgi:hypothetical protein
MPEPLFEGFQEQVFKELEVFFRDNKSSILDHFVPLPVYSVVPRNCMIGVSLHAPMLEQLELV